jgi:TolA-binding protein
MMRMLAAGAMLAALGNAPLQCGTRDSRSDSKLRTEDDAGDALYALALDFRAHGDEQGAKQTLRFLVEHYPSNRHVPEARAELGTASPAGAPAGAMPGDVKADAGK